MRSNSGWVSAPLYLAEKIRLSEFQSVVPENVVRSRDMKIQIRQHEAQQIALADEIYRVTAKFDLQL